MKKAVADLAPTLPVKVISFSNKPAFYADFSHDMYVSGNAAQRPPTPGYQFCENQRKRGRRSPVETPFRIITSPAPRFQYRYVGLLSSLPVFLSWHFLHSACQFDLSQKSFGSPRCGTIWSTTVAGVAMPCRRHSSQRGWSAKNFLLSRLQRLLYPRAAAVRFSSGCILLCSSQYVRPLPVLHSRDACRVPLVCMASLCLRILLKL